MKSTSDNVLSTDPRVVVVGVEGLSSSNFTRMLDEQHLPNLSRLVQNGILGECFLPGPPGSLPRWMSLVTGVYPARHGVMTYNRRTHAENSKTGNIGSQRWMPTLWDRLAQKGMRTVVSGFPCFAVAEPIQGVMIGNALESKSMYDVDDYQEDQSGQRNIFYPPENECDLVATFAESCQISSEAIAELYSNDGAGPINDLRIQKFLVEALLSTRSRIDLLEKSMQIESKWRLGLSYIPGSNRLDIQINLLVQGSHHRKTDLPNELKADYLKAKRIYWSYVDTKLGELFQTLGNTTLVLIGNNSSSVVQSSKVEQNKTPFDEDYGLSGPGLVLFSGPSCSKDQLIYGAKLVDIAPTILKLLGVDWENGMDGSPLRIFQQSKVDSSTKIEISEDGLKGNRTSAISGRMRSELDRIEWELRDLRRDVKVGQSDRDGRKFLLDQVTECADWLRASGLSVEATGFLSRVFDLVPESFLVGARLLRFLVARVLDGALSLEEIRGTLSQVVLAYEGLPSVARARVQGLEMQTLLAAVDEIENRSSRLNVHCPKNSEVLDRAGLTRLRIAAEQALSDQDRVIAKVLLRSLAEQKDASVWPFLQLSKLAVEENQFDEAISYAKSAISKRYGTPNAHYIIGYVEYVRKRYFDSITSLENALQLNPGLTPAARLLAHIKISIGCESLAVLDTGLGESPWRTKVDS